MEYKKSGPVHGQLDGRYVTLYEYEFPRATRSGGKFLPQGTARLHEFLFSDGKHGQLVQFIIISSEGMAKKNEQREMVDILLALNREKKKFRDGTLTNRELTGEIREYPKKKLICLDEVLATQEKIGRFASARRVEANKLRQRRIKRWKVRLNLVIITVFFVLGGAFGVLLQKYDLLDMSENPFYQTYIRPPVEALNRSLF